MSDVYPSLLSALALIKIFFCYHIQQVSMRDLSRGSFFFFPAAVLGTSIFCSVLVFFQANSSPASSLLFMLPSGSSYNLSRWKEICLKHYSTYQSADNPLLYSLRWKHWHRTAISVRVKTIKSSLVNNILFFVAKLGFGALLLKKKKKQFSKFSRIFPCAVYAARCVGEDLYVKVFRMLHREYSPVKKRKKNRCWELNFYISQGVLQICLSLSPGSEWQKLPTPALQSNCCSPNCCTQNEGVFFLHNTNLPFQMSSCCVLVPLLRRSTFLWQLFSSIQFYVYGAKSQLLLWFGASRCFIW